MANDFVGTIHRMTVQDVSNEGYLLVKGTEKAVLPRDFAKEALKANDAVDVFLFTDKKGRLMATEVLPKVVKGVFDWAEVVEQVPKLGVFVDIGSSVEVLVSVDDLPAFQSAWPVAGDKLYVTLSTDKQSRLLAVPGSERDFSDLFSYAVEVELNERVSGRVIRVDREGAVIITDEHYRAFIHHTEQEKEPRLGEYFSGRVIEVKEDGTLNVSLLPLKHERLSDDAEKIYAYLNKVGGEMPFGDKSDPEKIRQTFGMSKAAFKRALGRLMKERKVEQRDGKTFLTK